MLPDKETIARSPDDFPDPAEFGATVAGKEVDANFTVADAIAALNARVSDFAEYADVEELAIEAALEDDALAQGLLDAMLPIRNAIARELWARELLVAIEIVDHLLFAALKARNTPIIETVLGELRDARVGAPGLLVFGVHALGLTAASVADIVRREPLELIDGDWGVAISAQTNSIEKTIAFLDRVRVAFKIDGAAPHESVLHWRRSRGTRWLEVNPLLVVRVSEASGSYYGNEALLLARLQAATVLVSMLATVQPAGDATGRATMSSYVLNNRQTLDVHHYLVLSPGRAAGDELSGDCVPISRGRPDVVAMSELRMDLDTAYWKTETDLSAAIRTAVATVYRQYLQHGIDRSHTDPDAARSRRLFESTAYFQRSFSGQSWRDLTSLSTAFEFLLHDPTKGNTSKRIVNDIKRLIGSSSQATQHADAFRKVYAARNEIVHAGNQHTVVDMRAARRAFVETFVKQIQDA
jgi:hypothetical protein